MQSPSTRRSTTSPSLSGVLNSSTQGGTPTGAHISGSAAGGAGAGAGGRMSSYPGADEGSPLQAVNNKRKSEESGSGGGGNGGGAGSGQQSRAKRNRYISIACNECKRRKIKCNGETPCQRCGNLHLDCLYAPNCCSGGGFKDSDEYRQMNERMNYLQDQVSHLSQNVNALSAQELPMAHIEGSNLGDDSSSSFSLHNQASVPPGSPFKSRKKQQARHPRFQGPTSSAFSFDVAKSSLQTMGITDGDENLIDEGIATQDDTVPGSPVSLANNAVVLIPHPSKDPLWGIPLDEVIRLCRVYEEEMGMMYPILEIERVIAHAKILYKFMGGATRSGFVQLGREGADGISDDDTNVLKLVLANALMVEGGGQSELATRLFESVKRAADKRIWGGEIDLKGLSIFVLSSMYYFHQDEEPLAWRFIGITARMCIELGLHRRDSLMKGFDSEDDQRWAIRIFWSVYCLDRRWSMGTGMPFALQDSEIDPMLPEPDDSTAYLITMIAYGRISSKVWKGLAGLEHSSNDSKRDRIGYLDYQLLQWQASIPDSLKYLDPATGMEVRSPTRGIRRLRILLYLRSNQMRTLIYRPILHSATSTMENHNLALTAVEIAKDTIRILSQMNQTSDIYRSQEICFNYFLVSALAVLFLAVSHAPAQFSESCRDEFYMALDLIKGFSSKSYISKRLWRTIKGLKAIGPKLGLGGGPGLGPGGPDTNDDPTDAHSSAAVAMAGLAGHNVEDLAIYQQHKGLSPMGKSPLNGSQMSYELTNLFEAVGGFGSQGPASSQTPAPSGIGDRGSRGGYVNDSGSSSGSHIHGPDRQDHGPPHQNSHQPPHLHQLQPQPQSAPTMQDGMTPMFSNEEEFTRIMQNLF
ncbi:MAG: hypothetical protein M4579_007005 [Chaenotheca gracillima]|nr:MAG: hypothetical protein M4579_007005 [Chaenotheca gracillima]